MTARLPPARAGRREWIGLAVIALPCVLYSMNLTVLNLAVPQLSADLRPSGAQLLWIMVIVRGDDGRVAQYTAAAP